MPTKLEARVSQHDREIAAIRKLILTGMKMLTGIQVENKKIQAAQRKTEQTVDRLSATVDRFIKSMEGVGNGHSKTNLR